MNYDKQMSYDEQIVELTKNPDKIYEAWNTPVYFNNYGKTLFDKIGSEIDASGLPLTTGCLTQIRSSETYAAFIKGELDKELTNEIRADHRLPDNGYDITVEHLPIFKEWQERIDKLQTA